MAGVRYLPGYDARCLHELQLELECIRVGEGNLLSRIPCPNPDDVPRFLVALRDDGYSSYFRHDLPERVRGRLASLGAERAAENRDEVEAILGEDAPCGEVWRGRAYVFPDPILPEAYPDAARLPEPSEIGTPVFGVAIHGRIVSACSSSRENGRSAEAWVWTEPEYRRRGYARQAVSAWAHDLQRRGKVAFYSHNHDNLASQAVARGLGLKQFLSVTAYS